MHETSRRESVVNPEVDHKKSEEKDVLKKKLTSKNFVKETTIVGVYAKKYFAEKNAPPKDSGQKASWWSRFFIKYDNKWKFRFDLFMMSILIFVAMVVPVRLAFADEDSVAWVAVNYCIDGFFFLDLLLTFFTSYFDDKLLVEITDKK